jgi:hypothetical protein
VHIVDWLIQQVSSREPSDEHSQALQRLVHARTSVHNGDTPMHFATSSRRGEPGHRVRVLQSLLNAGADITLQVRKNVQPKSIELETAQPNGIRTRGAESVISIWASTRTIGNHTAFLRLIIPCYEPTECWRGYRPT